MSAGRIIGSIVVGALIVAIEFPASAQNRPTSQPDRERAQRTFAQYQKRILKSIQDELGSGDDEFKVLEPKITRVMLIEYEMSAGFSPVSRRRGLPGILLSALPPSEVQTARMAVRDALEDKNTPTNEITEKLKALRDARAAARAELTEAQDDLRQFLTLRQEAALVTMGLLE